MCSHNPDLIWRYCSLKKKKNRSQPPFHFFPSNLKEPTLPKPEGRFKLENKTKIQLKAISLSNDLFCLPLSSAGV